MRLFNLNGQSTIPPRPQSPAQIQRLEGRVLFAHLGHEVSLPDAAEAGLGGLERAIVAPADHHRSKFVAGFTDPSTDL